MSTLHDFDKANTPAEIVLSDETLTQIATKLGMEYFPYTAKVSFLADYLAGHAVLVSSRSPLEYMSFTSKGQPKIFWQAPYDVGKQELVYRPWFMGSGLTTITRAVEVELNLNPIIVPTPEPIIALPIPEWVDAVSDDYAWLSSKVGFPSELKPLALKFAKELLQQFGE